MIPGMNSRDMAKAMKKLGIQQQEIEAQEVIIKCEDKDIVISSPQVTKVNMMGQDTYQVIGTAVEQAKKSEVSEEDIQTVVEQTGVDAETAHQALEKNNGDIAKAILELKSTTSI